MYLQSGDTVAIVSPARAIEVEKVKPAIQLLESHGLKVLTGKNVFEINNQMAGTDQEKVEDLQKFINNPEVKAIINTRGGYGSVRLIDQLDLKPLANQKKWFVGYSDITVFHSHLHQNFNTPTVHATMPVNISENPSEQETISNNTLIKALFGEELNYNLPEHELSKKGNAKGILVGGNLSILYSLCGSSSDIDTSNKILFIEDLDEYLYHIDRMMMNLKRTGKLDHLKALIVGGMSDMNDNTIPYGKTAEEIILEHTADYNYPVYFGLEAGHTTPNRALRLGKEAVIQDNRLILPA
jgi:muramoyltetrapeptide carboxypeptidase